MIDKYLLTCLCLSLISCGDTQEAEKRLLKISNSNYLEAIASFVQNKSIVVLGEQDHVDGTAISVRIELIKYLHENHDFDLLIFESDFFSLISNLGEEQSLDNVFKVWNECGQFDELIDYYHFSLESEDPIDVLGIDNTHFTAFRKSHLVTFFETIYGVVLPEDLSGFNEYQSIIQKFEKSGQFVNLSDDEVKSLKRLYTAFSLHDGPNALLGQQELSNLISVSNNARDLRSNQLNNNLRDTQMFENFQWLKKHVIGNKKCIVWTTNSHGHKSFNSVKDLRPFQHDTINFGTLLNDKFPDNTYHIGFSSYSGSSGRFYTEDTEITTSKRSLEYLFYQVSSASPVFLDFNGLTPSCQDTSFVMSPIGHFSQKGQWLNLFDGVILVKNMTPCDSEKVYY